MTRRDKARKQRYKHEAQMWRGKADAANTEILRLRTELRRQREVFGAGLKQVEDITAGMMMQCIDRHGPQELDYERGKALAAAYRLKMERSERGIVLSAEKIRAT